MNKRVDKSSLEDASDLNHKAYGDGVKQYKLGNFKNAKHDFKLALEYWPEDSQAWFALGNCFDEMKRPKRAEKCFRKALFYTQANNESKIYYNLGNSLYDQEKFAEAIECYLKVSAQSTVYTVARENLVRAKNGIS